MLKSGKHGAILNSISSPESPSLNTGSTNGGSRDDVENDDSRKPAVAPSKEEENATHSLDKLLSVSSTKDRNRNHKRDSIPLLEKLKIIQVLGKQNARKVGSKQENNAPPQEVVIERINIQQTASATLSELPVEGFLSAVTIDQKRPSRFTFDVVPSRSSLDEESSYSPLDAIRAIRSGFVEDMIDTPIMPPPDGYEIDDLSEPSGPPPHHNNLRDEHRDHNKPRTACTETTTTSEQQQSIEFSESQYLRSNSAEKVAEKFNIFSPVNSRDKGDDDVVIDHGFDAIAFTTSTSTSKNEEEVRMNKKEAAEEAASGSKSFLNFGLLSLW